MCESHVERVILLAWLDSGRHITALLAAAETLANARQACSGTLVLCFQPVEERAGGAQNMVDDGLDRKAPEPDVVIGGHVIPFLAGVIGTKHGLMATSADSFKYCWHAYESGLC